MEFKWEKSQGNSEAKCTLLSSSLYLSATGTQPDTTEPEPHQILNMPLDVPPCSQINCDILDKLSFVYSGTALCISAVGFIKWKSKRMVWRCLKMAAFPSQLVFVDWGVINDNAGLIEGNKQITGTLTSLSGLLQRR